MEKGKTQVVKTPSHLSLSIGAITGRAAILSVRTLMISMIRPTLRRVAKFVYRQLKTVLQALFANDFFFMASI